MTYDDAQSSLDHVHPHRTPLFVVSPYARPGYVAKQHYVTASVVKTEELMLGLPPNNLGDLLATDLRDMFQPQYNGVQAEDLAFAAEITYQPSPEGKKIWSPALKLETSAPDRDSHRLGVLTRITLSADELFNNAKQKGTVRSRAYRSQQKKLYKSAQNVIRSAAPRDLDD